jgi:hypothetical protein
LVILAKYLTFCSFLLIINGDIVDFVFCMKLVLKALLIVCGNFLFACGNTSNDDCPDVSEVIVTNSGKRVSSFTNAPPPSPVNSRALYASTQEELTRIRELIDGVVISGTFVKLP